MEKHKQGIGREVVYVGGSKLTYWKLQLELAWAKVYGTIEDIDYAYDVASLVEKRYRYGKQ